VPNTDGPMIVWVTVIIAVQAVALLLIQGHQRRVEKREDYRRQDEVAARVTAAADQAATAAGLLVDRQAESDRQATHTAELLAANNEKVAESAAETKVSLRQIDGLVNANLTREKESRLVLMREVVELNLAAGRQPSPAAVAAIAELEAELQLRAEQLQEVTEMAEGQPPPSVSGG